MDLKDELVEIERTLWTNDPDVYETNLTEQAVLVFAETGVIGRDIAVDAIRHHAITGTLLVGTGLGLAVARRS